MRIIKNKKGLNINNYILGGLFFTILVAGTFSVLGNQDSPTFFSNYGYSFPSENTNLSQFDLGANYSRIGTNIGCDVVGGKDNLDCKDKKENPLQVVGNFIEGMVLKGFSGLVTVGNSIGLTSKIIGDAGTSLNIPGPYTTGLITALAISLFVTIMFIIFNRSDAT